MILFLLLLFPLGFLFWCHANGFEKFPKFLLIAFFGLFPAAVFCAYKFFFSPFYYLAQDSFLRNFLYVFLFYAFIPLVVLTAVFLFISKKDSFEGGLENIFPLYAGFYSVYIPFRVLNVSTLSFFLLFAKPLIYFFMLASLCCIYKTLFVKSNFLGIKAAARILLVFVFAFVLLAPAAIEAAWTIGMPVFAVALFVAVYLVFTILLNLMPKFPKI